MADLSVLTLDSFLDCSEEVVPGTVEEAVSVPAETDQTDQEPGEPKHTSTPHKAHLCGGCGRQYKTASNLHKHAKMAHGSGDGPTFECEQCGKGYMERVYFEAHSNRHKKIAPHTCPTPTCGKAFKNMVC
ncbi:zinc finger protein 70-like, partial [Littorina saxatilis]